jgi:arylsulfatase A
MASSARIWQEYPSIVPVLTPFLTKFSGFKWEGVALFENYYQKDDPFFLYIAFHEPHKKVASPPALVQKYSDYPKKAAEYLANVENMDSAAGRIIKYIEDKNLADNTIIVFSSDNGSYRGASNGELRAVKSYLYDGGIRVPGIFRWDENIPASTTITAPAGFVDIFPTICDITSIKLPEGVRYDGTSILPLLRKEKFERKNPLFWFFYRTSPEIAMRIGDKMILGRDVDSIPRAHRFSSIDMEYIKEMEIREYELFNLRNDPEQKKNLFTVDKEAESYSILLDQKLLEIQQKGYYWDSLPAPDANRRIKTDWVRYKLNP